MKKLLLALSLALALFVSTRVESAPAAANANSEVPDIVAAGFNAYQNTGSSAAISTWIKGSPLEVSGDARTRYFNTLSGAENTYGTFIGWETVRTVNLSTSTKLVYAIAKYTKGPVWIAFGCYRGNNSWVVPTIVMNTDPVQVLPEQMRSGL